MPGLISPHGRQPLHAGESIVRVPLRVELRRIGRQRRGGRRPPVGTIERPDHGLRPHVQLQLALRTADLERSRKREERQGAAEIEVSVGQLIIDTRRRRVGLGALVVGEIAPFERLVVVVEHLDSTRFLRIDVQKVDPHGAGCCPQRHSRKTPPPRRGATSSRPNGSSAGLELPATIVVTVGQSGRIGDLREFLA